MHSATTIYKIPLQNQKCKGYQVHRGSELLICRLFSSYDKPFEDSHIHYSSLKLEGKPSKSTRQVEIVGQDKSNAIFRRHLNRKSTTMITRGCFETPFVKLQYSMLTQTVAESLDVKMCRYSAPFPVKNGEFCCRFPHVDKTFKKNHRNTFDICNTQEDCKGSKECYTNPEHHMEKCRFCY